MVYGETVEIPLSLRVKCIIIKYWSRLITCQARKLSSFIYKFIYNLHINNIYHSLLFVKKIQCDTGFSGVWQSQTIPTGIDLFNNNILQRLRDQFIQQWNSDIDNSPEFINFRMLKLNFDIEKYLISLPSALWIPLCKFRCRNHKLPVEKFRQNSEDRNLRYCTLCHINEVGNEFHYVLKCPFFAEQRLLLLCKRTFTHPSIFTFNHVMNASGTKLLKLSKLMQIIVKNVNGSKKCCNFTLCLPSKK